MGFRQCKVYPGLWLAVFLAQMCGGSELSVSLPAVTLPDQRGSLYPTAEEQEVSVCPLLCWDDGCGPVWGEHHLQSWASASRTDHLSLSNSGQVCVWEWMSHLRGDRVGE